MRRARGVLLLSVILVVCSAASAFAEGPTHLHGEGCGHYRVGDAWLDFPDGHFHDPDCGHFFYAGEWHLFPEGHEHGADCGHFYANGRWDYFPSKHRHGEGCGHFFHGGMWHVFPRGHLHAPGCGHSYWAGCWQVLPQGHVHGADCGHIFAFGDWRPLTPGERARLASAAAAVAERDRERGVWARPYDDRLGAVEARADEGARRFPRPADPGADEPVIAGGVPLTIIDLRRPGAGRVTAVAPAPQGLTASATAETLRAAGLAAPAPAPAPEIEVYEAQVVPAAPLLEPEVLYLESRVTAYPPGLYEPDIAIGRVVVPHVHGTGCGHLYTQGAWKPTGLPPERGYDDVFPRGPTAYFVVPNPPPPHVHATGCGHVYTSGRWQPLPSSTREYTTLSLSGCGTGRTGYSWGYGYSGSGYGVRYSYGPTYGSGSDCRPETRYQSSIQHRAGCRCATCCPPRIVRYPSGRSERRYR